MLMKEVKKNKPVKFVRRNGQTAVGIVHELPEVKANGTWVQVNTGSKKAPDLTSVRLEKLEPDTVEPAVAAPVAKKPVVQKAGAVKVTPAVPAKQVGAKKTTVAKK